jgi:glycine/sarcosine N-methyltransferase
MSFYRSIADYYDLIFPLEASQVDFVKSGMDGPYPGKMVLDAGSGTGNLAIALSQAGFEVAAIDSDPEMLRKAEGKKTAGSRVTFALMDMREIAALFTASSFDAVLCFGNTLVHLDGLPEIEDFCAQSRDVLRDGGAFFLQILNYDHILDHHISALPLIENDAVMFVRLYEYDREKNRILFKTRLTVKGALTEIENEIPLYPLRRDELEAALRKSGFTNIEFYGGFDKGQLKADSLPLVVRALNPV